MLFRARPLATLAVALSALLLAIACQATAPGASQTPDAGKTTQPPAATAEPGPRADTPDDTIVIGTNRSPDTLDPHIFFSDAWPEPVYLYLVTSVDEEFQPVLAESWRAVDPTRVEFTLREGVTFEDGTPVTADDVKATFDRVNDDSFAAAALVRQYIGGLTGVDVIDDRTFAVNAAAPDPLIVGRMWRIGIVSRDWIENASPDEIASTTNGTGPYTVTEFVPKTRIVAEAREGSPIAPGMPRLVIESLPEYAARIAALRAGEIDLAEEVRADDIAPLRAEGIVVESFARAGGIALGVLPVEEFADVRVRQAMDLAIDRQGIVDSIYQGAAQPLQSQPTPEGLTGYNADIEAVHDPEAARQLMAEAGFADGFSAEVRYPPQNAPMATVAQALPGMFQDIDIDLSLDAVELAVFLQRTRENPNGNGPLYMALSSFLVPDASWHLSFWRVPNNRGFDNPEFNDLYTESQLELDPERRTRLLQQLVKMVSDEKLFLYIVAPSSTAAWYPDVSGFEIGLVGFQRYFDVIKQR